MRILLANENPSLRSALALLIETRLNARVVGEAHNMENLLVDLQVTRPDVLILDWKLPGLPKVDRIALLHQAHPGMKVVVLGTQPEGNIRSLPAYADAYISKSEPPEKMVSVLQGI